MFGVALSLAVEKLSLTGVFCGISLTASMQAFFVLGSKSVNGRASGTFVTFSLACLGDLRPLVVLYERVVYLEL